MTKTSPPPDQPNLRGMSSPLEFWDTVRRECDRADRYNMRLSMAVYEIGIRDEKNLLVRTLVRRLAHRVRNMDFIGWFDPGQIGILMPHTPNDGAIKLAQDVYDLLSPLTSPPPFTIYTYPSDRWPVKKSIHLRLLKVLNNIRMLINPQGIATSDELRAQLGMELDRANRYGHSFSLLIFHCATVSSHGIQLTKLAKALNNRLRETDTFGWHGSGDIAVILPYATLDDATRIGQNICTLAGIPATGSFTSYSYPHQWLGEKHDSPPVISLTQKISPGPLPSDVCRQDEKLGQSLPDQKKFNASLDKEIMRAMLNGNVVSLLQFHVKPLVAHGGSVQTLAQTLSIRLREIDLFGWHKEGEIAALLPCTGHQDAIKLGQAICALMSLSEQELVTIYTYPTHWFPNHAPLSQSDNHRSTLRSSDCDCRRINERSVGPAEIENLIAKPVPSWKRAIDITGALCSIVLLSPIFVAAAIGIKISSPGPIFFRQTRIGYKRKPFVLLKFRSMHAHANAEKHRKFMKQIISNDTDRPNTKIETDERIFPFGLFLRKTSIDELPQLFNVLKGEMSLVGPRPCLDYEADEYLQWHTRRFYILPGITGLWQVSGKNRLSFKQMIRLDIQYAKKLSLWMDIKILLKTIPALGEIYFEKHT